MVPLNQSLPFTPLVEELGWFEVDGPGAAGMARRAAVEAAQRLRFDEIRVAEIAIVLSEVGSNLHKHAGQGWIAVRCLRGDSRTAVEIVAVDAGPGMADIILSGQDGHSTAGTLGIGLGAVVRLSSRCEVYSVPGRGTVLTARFWPRGPAFAEQLPAEGLSRPMVGERVCGDRFALRAHSEGPLMMVADGLGHGPAAAAAAAAAVEAFRTTDLDGPAAIVEHLHRSIKHTRGAAIAIAQFEAAHRVVRFAGVGNIEGFVVGDGARRGMVSLPGIVGVRAGSVREFSYPLEPDAIVVLHSDGVTNRWSIPAYPGLAQRSPLVIAATLLRDAGKDHDDGCVLVAKPVP